ncbi:AAA family ATPase [Marivirga sp. S37H4]|uniref:AAA family ATPase n=1 Tax=Marivirga aurantiaca TaxID=2802615 RepID=A0A934WXG3_9BACT|nr:AAA family ATPase [Marivirga aurantiaca]MBK6264933.1 AAA family ATPase [Marivirga aurantiaca]
MKNEINSNSPKVSAEFVNILKQEVVKSLSICRQLNSDKEFSNIVAQLANDSHSASHYKAEYVLMADILQVYNDYLKVSSGNNANESGAKFILIYLYEMIQGKDLSTIYSLEKLNALTTSEQFDKNIQLIRNTSFIQAVKAMEGELMLSSVLAKMKSELLPGLVGVINRIASLMVKSDGSITKAEEEFLKQILEKLNHPKIIISHSDYKGIPENDTLEIVLDELNDLIGLDGIKGSVNNLTNFLKIQKIREEEGLKTTKNALHAVFMGPPGTGKTTVARLLGRIYKHLGYLKNGHVVETDRAGLVAGYVGQTAIKAEEIIKQAEGGVLFIDEAYSLSSGGLNDFGQEAIEILLKRMEDKRSDLVIVVAGYPDEMEIFIQSNPGLQSRFNRYFEFDHFEPEALLEIFKLYVTNADFVLSEDAEEKVMAIIERAHEKRHRGFGNARTMRNLFEKIIEKQANRIVIVTPITKEILMTITEEDVPEVLKAVDEIILFDQE